MRFNIQQLVPFCFIATFELVSAVPSCGTGTVFCANQNKCVAIPFNGQNPCIIKQTSVPAGKSQPVVNPIGRGAAKGAGVTPAGAAKGAAASPVSKQGAKPVGAPGTSKHTRPPPVAKFPPVK